MMRIALSAASLCFMMGTSVEATKRPIIGVLTQPYDSPGSSYIDADYVKYVESSGARVAVIPFDAPTEHLDTLLSSINGLIYPGGGDILNGTQYYNVSKYIFNKAIEMNDKGDYFPLWGTCLGFEFMSIVVSGTIDSLTYMNATKISLTQDFTPYGVHESRLFSVLDHHDKKKTLDYLSTHKVSENYHHWGLATKTFEASSALVDFYDIIATSVDLDGTQFVSSFEAKRYPFYAVQYHPERSMFEWSLDEDIDRSEKTIAAMQYHSRFLVKESTKNKHKFDSVADELKALIDNYSPAFIVNNVQLEEYDVTYVFNSSPVVEVKDSTTKTWCGVSADEVFCDQPCSTNADCQDLTCMSDPMNICGASPPLLIAETM